MTFKDLQELSEDTCAMTEDKTPAFTPVQVDKGVQIYSRIEPICWEVEDLEKIDPEHVMNFVSTGKTPILCSHCRSARVYKMTRIVGYFSRVPNWNKSKLGELKDRRQGDYKIGSNL